MLTKLRNKQIRVRPIARRIDHSNVELEAIDDKWIVSFELEDTLSLQNARTQQSVRLGTDHVREYMTDSGKSDGFLLLKSQIVTTACRGAFIEPIGILR
jgi:hypothetical protein